MTLFKLHPIENQRCMFLAFLYELDIKAVNVNISSKRTNELG